MKTIPSLLAATISLCFFFIINSLLSSSLSSISAISTTVWSDHEDVMMFYFDNSSDGPKYSGKKTSTRGRLKKDKKVTFTVKLRNNGVKWLRMDPGNTAGTTRIYSIIIHPSSKKKKRLNASEIYKMFDSSKDGVQVTLKDEYVEIVSQDEDPYLFTKNIQSAGRAVGLFSIPILILSFYLFIFLRKLQWQSVQNYFLIGRELPQGAELVQPLDGLRGIAAIWVVAEHSWTRFGGTGFSGVMVFFALSGFLLTRPFVLTPSKLYKPGFLLTFGMRRLQRILPMYYLYIFLVYWMPLRLGEALLHTFFLKGNGHLWTIPQEMIFYLIFPLIVLVNSALLKNKLLLILPGLVVSFYCWNTMVDTKTVYLWGALNQPIPFMLNSFLVGVFFSYLYYGVIQNKPTFCHNIRIRYVAAIGGILILIGFSFFSGQAYTLKYPNISRIFAGLVIVLVLCSPKTFFTRLLSNPLLCSLGTVSYSLYLLHPLVIGFTRGISSTFFGTGLKDYVLFLIALSVSYLVACFTYRVVERPFLKAQ